MVIRGYGVKESKALRKQNMTDDILDAERCTEIRCTKIHWNGEIKVQSTL